MHFSIVLCKQHLKISSVLIANRGEIATRIMRTAMRLGIETIAVYSDVDANAMHVKTADRAYHIGEAPALSSYLCAERIVQVANEAGAKAIHPGYGFLSENAEFAERCFKAGLKFIGPSVEAIRAMGQKNRAKKIMIAAGVPTLPGYNGKNQEDQHMLSEAKKIGFPVMIKPVYGGGGKGMRITYSTDDFFTALESARSESTKSFGNAEMIIEKYINDPRHVEVQVFGDAHKNYVYLWERDCSIQRRHQKIIEEAPAPGLSQKTRLNLGSRAVDAARAVKYEGAGTVEFIMDKNSGEFFFMEMNTRLQVEHPVTEAITGVDLVEWQFRVAEGGKIPLQQSEIPLNGHAVEARIYAEDFDKNTMQFMPTAGKLEYFEFPGLNCSRKDGDSVRIDTGVSQGDEVSVHYDPMIAKVITHGATRSEAIARLNHSLGVCHISGVCNNIALVRACLSHSQFENGEVSTGFVETHKAALFDALEPKVTQNALCEAAVSNILLKTLTAGNKGLFGFSDFFRVNYCAKHKFQLNEKFTTEVEIVDGKNNIYRVRDLSNKEWTTVQALNIVRIWPTVYNDFLIVEFALKIGGGQWKCKAVQLTDSIFVWSGASGNGGETRKWPICREQQSSESELKNGASDLTDARSPISGIVEKVFVNAGDCVKKAQILAIMSAMKMEFVIKAPNDCIVVSIECKPKDFVSKNAILLKLDSVV